MKDRKRFAMLFCLCAGIVGTLPFLVSLLAGPHSHTRPSGMSDIRFDLSRSGRILVFSGAGEGARDLYLLDLMTKKVSRVTSSPDYENGPCFLPDDKHIVFAAGTPGERTDHIYTCAIDGHGIKRLTSDDYNDRSPSVSTDGRQIVFIRDLDYRWGGFGTSWGERARLCIADMSASNVRDITSDLYWISDPVITDDNKTVLFCANDSKPKSETSDMVSSMELFATNSRSAGKSRRLTSNRGVQYVRSSPDGQHLALLTTEELVLTDIDGSNGRVLVKTAASCLRFDATGKRILYLAETEMTSGSHYTPSCGLWEVDLKGSRPRKIAGCDLFVEPMNWNRSASTN